MWWHTVTHGGEVKGKLANAVGSQYPSHYLGTWCIQHYYRWWHTPRLPVVDWTDAPRRFKWTRPFLRKTKRGFCACAITFQLASASTGCYLTWTGSGWDYWFHSQNDLLADSGANCREEFNGMMVLIKSSFAMGFGFAGRNRNRFYMHCSYCPTFLNK